MKTIIHVNQHIIRKNHKTGERKPVLTVKTSKSNDYLHSVILEGPARVIYSPDKPLPCGAKVWIETHGEVWEGESMPGHTNILGALEALVKCIRNFELGDYSPLMDEIFDAEHAIKNFKRLQK